MAVSFKRQLARRIIRGILRPMLRWQPLDAPVYGYSIILGVPWGLRHLLPVNLRFVARTDLTDLVKLYIVFDRTQRPGAEDLIRDVHQSFAQLPIEFLFHPPVAGKIVERINVSTYYNSMNCVTALSQCRTKYALLHDFDLYPLEPGYFREVVQAMQQRGLRFCGLEYTLFDGLTEEDRLIGTWCLGMDVEWLRANHRPIDCFQRIARLDGRLIQLDPFSYLQTKTSERDLVKTLDGRACCHVGNLCGTYIRYKTGRKPDFVWRLHYLWYLESLSGYDDRLSEVMEAMQRATSGNLRLGPFETDFSRTHVGCANVLREKLEQMEKALFGGVRPEVHAYLDAFAEFLKRCGDRTPLHQDVKLPRADVGRNQDMLAFRVRVSP